MNIPPEKLEGRKLCVVFVKVLDEASGKVQLQCLRGRANVERGRVSVVDEKGFSFMIPGTASNQILPSDGTPLLRDAEFFCLVKLDNAIDLAPRSDIFHIESDDDDCDCGCGHHHHHH